MLFTSVDFVLFLPIAIGLYFATPHRWRWLLLLAASYTFYAWWRVEYLALIVASTLVDYAAGLLMGRVEEKKKRKPYLWLSLVSNLGILFAFKYYGLFAETANTLVALFGGSGSVSVLDVLLPVGISFYTFQTLAYSIDVYRGQIEPERHLGIFALYVSFWPQLVAGPIERASHLLPQFHEDCPFDRALFVSGLQVMVWGFFLKVVVADRCVVLADALYRNPDLHHGEAVLVGLYFSAFHIYADFAGYSLIAIGTARMMGFRLMDNFRQPYFASTMGEVWRRWHISLTTWYRDYLYIPLRKDRKLGAPAAIFIVFAVTGFWHGAAWKFLLWGALHGVYLIIERGTQDWRDRLWARVPRRNSSGEPAVYSAGLSGTAERVRHAAGVLWTFHMWIFLNVFVFIYSISDAPHIYYNILTPGNWKTLLDASGLSRYHVAVAVLSIGALLFVDLIERKERITEWVARRPAPVRWTLYTAVVLSILMFGEFGHREFFYFQF